VASRGGAVAAAAEYATAGARLSAQEARATAEMFGKSFELVEAEAGTPAEAAERATELAGKAKSVAVLGGLDEATCRHMAQALAAHRVLYVNAGSPAESLRGAGCHRTAFHVEVSLAAYADALAVYLVRQAKAGRVALLTGEDAAGRNLEGAVRRAIGRAGGTIVETTTAAPGTSDFRAVLSPLLKAGPQALILNLAGPDLYAAVRQAREGGAAIPLLAPLVEPVEAWAVDAGALPDAWPSLWSHDFRPYSGRELNSRFRKGLGRPGESRMWAHWCAVKVLWEAVLKRGSTAPADLIPFLEGDVTFDGHKGMGLSFRPWDHQLRQPLLILRRESAPKDRWGAFGFAQEVPLRGTPGATEEAVLDTLGLGPSETACRFGPIPGA
jgi:ABC transporter substrate binding protein (PQQ-dependent alcohol dehydrogenase system)